MPLKLVTKKCYYFWSCTRLVTVLLKIKCSHIGHLVEVENTTETEMSSFDEIFIIGCTGNWQNVSFHYHQCCKFHQKEILSVWVSSRNWWNDHQSNNKSVTLTAFHTTCDDKAVVLTTRAGSKYVFVFVFVFKYANICICICICIWKIPNWRICICICIWTMYLNVFEKYFSNTAPILKEFR